MCVHVVGHVKFNVYLLYAFIYRNIKSVEEHVKESILNEMSGTKGLFKNVKIDTSSIVVKRLLDTELIQFASFFKEQMQVNFELNFI